MENNIKEMDVRLKYLFRIIYMILGLIFMAVRKNKKWHCTCLLFINFFMGKL